MVQPKQGLLILGFNRPQMLRKCLEAVVSSPRSKQLHAFFSLDGPRPGNARDEKLILETRNVFADFQGEFESVSWLVSKENLGLRGKMFSSVDASFSQVNELLVLEDDQILGKHGLDFFCGALEDYHSHSRVGAVSGTYFGPRLPFLHTKLFEAQRLNTWGWATWGEVWQEFRSSKFGNSPLVEQAQDLEILSKTYPLPYRIEYARMRKNVEFLDSYSIPFGMFLKSRGLTTLKPLTNIVKNIGFGDDATHTKTGARLAREAMPSEPALGALSPVWASRLFEFLEAWNKALIVLPDVVVHMWQKTLKRT